MKWFNKVQNALTKMISGTPLGKQTKVPKTPQAQYKAARGHAAGEYHYGRVSTIKSVLKNGNVIKSFRVGPVPDPSGETYRGARPATYDHLLKAVGKTKVQDIVVAAYGRLYPGSKRFSWVGIVADKGMFITAVNNAKNSGQRMEDFAFQFFSLKAGVPDLIVAWEVKDETR